MECPGSVYLYNIFKTEDNDDFRDQKYNRRSVAASIGQIS